MLKLLATTKLFSIPTPQSLEALTESILKRFTKLSLKDTLGAEITCASTSQAELHLFLPKLIKLVITLHVIRNCFSIFVILAMFYQRSLFFIFPHLSQNVFHITGTHKCLIANEIAPSITENAQSKIIIIIFLLFLSVT